MKLLLVGTGGYAKNYVKLLLENQIPDVIWEGIVDPYYSACEYKENIDALGIPVYATMEEFYQRHTANLAVISTPTFLHCSQSICALKNGSHVLCEKPAAPTVKEAEEMLEAQKTYGRFIAIGYQWSYSEAIQKLKADVAAGLFGKPVSLKTAISWPRGKAYYSRGGGWAGRVERDGHLILDSIASNACAHYLHNMLFLLGKEPKKAADPILLQAECYRANEIENFDTCCIKMKTEDGARLYFAATHAAEYRRNPQFVYTFQKGKVFYSQDEGSQIVAEFSDGSRKTYGDPFENPFKKLWDAIECAKKGTSPLCTVETALPHVKLIEKLYQTTPVQSFAKELLGTEPKLDAIYVKGLYEALYRAYEQEALFTETDPTLF